MSETIVRPALTDAQLFRAAKRRANERNAGPHESRGGRVKSGGMLVSASFARMIRVRAGGKQLRSLYHKAATTRVVDVNGVDCCVILDPCESLDRPCSHCPECGHATIRDAHGAARCANRSAEDNCPIGTRFGRVRPDKRISDVADSCGVWMRALSAGPAHMLAFALAAGSLVMEHGPVCDTQVAGERSNYPFSPDGAYNGSDKPRQAPPADIRAKRRTAREQAADARAAQAPTAEYQDAINAGAERDRARERTRARRPRPSLLPNVTHPAAPAYVPIVPGVEWQAPAVPPPAEFADVSDTVRR